MRLPRPQQARAQTTVDAVVHAAQELVLSGADRLPSVKTLVDVSGVSIGSIYHHFGDVDGVADSAFVAFLQAYREGLVHLLDDVTDGEHLVSTIVKHHVAWMCAVPPRTRFLRRHRGRLRDDAGVRASTGQFLGAVARQLSTAQPTLAAVSSSLWQPLVLGPAEALCHHWLDGRLPKNDHPEQHVAQLAAAAWASLRAASSASSAQ